MIELYHWVQARLAPTIIRIPAVQQRYLIPEKKKLNPTQWNQFSHLVTSLEAASIFSPEQPHHLKNFHSSTRQLLQRQRRPSELRYGRRRGDKCAHHCISHRSTETCMADTDREFFSLHGTCTENELLRPLRSGRTSGCPTPTPNSCLLSRAGSQSPFFQAPSLSPPRQLDRAGAGDASIYYQGAPA
jgi:hypothetical protein